MNHNISFPRCLGKPEGCISFSHTHMLHVWCIITYINHKFGSNVGTTVSMEVIVTS